MLRRQTSDIFNLAGFAAEGAAPGAEFHIVTRGSFSSDDPLFYVVIRQVSELVLNPHAIPAGQVANLLALIHPDNTVDLYLNDELVVSIEIAAKKSIAAGQAVLMSDIADIRRLQFHGVSIAPTDKVLYCFKVGWKFGLFFDLERPVPLDVDRMALSIGAAYRTLAFEHVYRTLESEEVAKAMFDAGWFPFIEILTDYEALAGAYRDKTNVDQAVQKLVGSFTEERIGRMTEGWWDQPAFKEKQAILQAGIKAYLQDTPDGFIACIKTLGTEIEGLLRHQYLVDKGTAEGKAAVLLNHLVEKGRQKTGSGSSLFLPDYFLEYLHDKVFANFDLGSIAAGVPIAAGRHSVSHGAASPAAYTREAALQMILVFDQIRFFSK
jgi:hypothetical protein